MTDVIDTVFDMRGIFRETFSGFVQENMKDGARSTKAYSPMLLVSAESGALLQVDDVIIIGGDSYRVIAKPKSLAGVAYDVSLAVV